MNDGNQVGAPILESMLLTERETGVLSPIRIRSATSDNQEGSQDPSTA